MPSVRFDPGLSGPLAQFREWYRKADGAGIARAEAMALATADPHGRPSVRFVLLKRCDPRGLVFFTNARSCKGRQLTANPYAAAVFFWERLGRQVIVRGPVKQIPEAESDEYWESRPRGSQIAALASNQSERIGSRRELVAKVRRLEAGLGNGEVPRPPHWCGFVLRPEAIEFWSERPSRLHDRELFARKGARWTRTLLQP
ncbi:MAG: pyridoxamine 5'-phosphate oxidase [Candidatus Binataceae bacterium]